MSELSVDLIHDFIGYGFIDLELKKSPGRAFLGLKIDHTLSIEIIFEIHHCVH